MKEMGKLSLARLLTAFVLVPLVACGGRSPVARPAMGARPGPVSLPDPVPASAAFVAGSERPLSPRAVQRVRRIAEVAVAAPMSRATVEVQVPDGERTVAVASVEPLRFRALAPPATKAADFVWIALVAGKAVVTFEAARALGVDGPASLGLADGRQIAVGALAENGLRNVADVVVHAGLGRALGLGRPKILVVGAKPGASLAALRRKLETRLPNVTLTALESEEPAGQAPEVTGQVAGSLIGRMTFRVLKSGFIAPDPAWVAASIAIGEVPILGSVTCHRLMFPQLSAALADVQEAGLAHTIHPGDYGGCYVPRFIERDPRRGLSMHAFGLAVDLNVANNQVGTRGNLDPRVVAIFERWGFEWGGRWRPSDPMHFELARLIDVRR